ncbi:double-strand break repair protein AddB [Pseudorhodobacter antarcticus]|uniref:Double-strand break repair protein AddB n=1 Tax=Pseudorhodobacter antarcticus TaxID=1077947 RepID=A0A1H8HIP0_9RHOB|nr:double-strand break repair protein AddB [Pseudorhodobacter antarcticus]SEN55899.1 double-strand break repair protein AddB [Pseudorhodobacter antarcticus]
MFDTPGPRIFALPPGADFPAQLVTGLTRRMSEKPSQDMARVTLYVNTTRMARRVTALFIAQGAGFLPRIRLVTDLQAALPTAAIPAAVSPLRQRLILAQLIEGLLNQQPDLAPRSALYDLADSLATLLDEMQGEGVLPEKIASLDVANHSAHWARTREFMAIVAQLLGQMGQPDSQTRQRMLVNAIIAAWQVNPPTDPVIVAGSTGSRGTTALFMQAVAALPQGALVLPGFDFDMPTPVWNGLADAMTAEDHPQYRFFKLMQIFDITPADVRVWAAAPAPNPVRNALISLSLRPAPVTDQWLTEGKLMQNLPTACADMTLIEAPTPRAEAMAIALILRKAAEDGVTAALISPDRGLTRQVTSALDRWGILPDDSAGRPLALSAPGRYLRHILGLFSDRMTSEALLILLKHPLTASGRVLDGKADRGHHLLFTRNLELKLRRRGPAFPTGVDLVAWACAEKDEKTLPWAQWLARVLDNLVSNTALSLADHITRHRALAEALALGPNPDATTSGLWEKAAGIEALAKMTELAAEAEHGGTMTPTDYRHLFEAFLNKGEVREPLQSHPRIMVWGTIEARVQGADLVILGGLNDGIWPQSPPPDPWMNRAMRLEAGLLLPERRIGLSAHDYQQAIAAPQVVISRATRNADAETVASRWVNRLTNLLGGLPNQGGQQALAEMRARGRAWLELASAAERPDPQVPTARRPAPRPPVSARPAKLAVTGIKTLLRDPYAIYARHILRLFRLNLLRPSPDALLRGSVLHLVLETFTRTRPENEQRDAARTRLLAIAETVLTAEVPWPAARALWLSRLHRAADFFLGVEAALGGTPVVIEERGAVQLTGLPFTLTAIPDRIDMLPDGRVHIFDYKTGTPPSKDQQKFFDKQLVLEAAMATRGAFSALQGPREVAGVTYIGLGSTPKQDSSTPDDTVLGQVWEELHHLIREYMDPARGYVSRRAMHGERFAGDYDHLARFGEWEMTDDPVPEDMT